MAILSRFQDFFYSLNGKNQPALKAIGWIGLLGEFIS